MTQNAKTLAIIGGGAAGLVAGIVAGERARARGAALDIVIYERDDRVGRSILVTGNGRCNFSNAEILSSKYYNAEFVGDALAAVDSWCERSEGDSVTEFLESCGLVWRQESEGRRYPLANKASVVVDVLRAAAADVGVREECESDVACIDPPRAPGKPFTLRLADGVFRRADSVIVACGGKAVSSLEMAGVPRLRTRPVLGPLKVAADDIPFTRELDNIRVKCIVSLERREGDHAKCLMTERGELMFRKYGVSGICVFDMSRFAWPGDVLRIDFLQAGDRARAVDFLARRRTRLERRFGVNISYDDMLRGLVLPRVAEAVLKNAGISPDAPFQPECVDALADLLQAYPLEVAGMANIENCQVRRGGFSVEAFDPLSMAALDVPGLYAAGEALDVDGPCGGYNLHWAWASGMIAGRAAADSLVEGVLG